jgi:hypothetical protein
MDRLGLLSVSLVPNCVLGPLGMLETLNLLSQFLHIVRGIFDIPEIFEKTNHPNEL